MSKIILYFKELIQVDRILFGKKEYIMWYLILLLGLGISCSSIVLHAEVIAFLGLLIMLLPVSVWVSRATDYIKKKEHIGTIQNKEERG